MTKKSLVIISAILIILVALVAGYYLLGGSNNSSTEGGIVSKFKNFFPFGQTSLSTTTPFTQQPNGTSSPYVPDATGQKLRELSTEPVAGFGIINTKAGVIVRYVEKATGNIYDVELFSPNKTRVSNTTIPVTYNASWGSASTTFITQYLEQNDQTIDTYSLNISQNGTSSDAAIKGIVLSDTINNYSLFGSEIFYLEQTNSGSIGTISNMDGTKKRQVWNSPIKEMLSQFVNPSVVALTTKPYPNVPGFLYFINTKTGQVKKIIGDTLGLSTLVNPDASQVLLTEQTDVNKMYTYSVTDRSIQTIIPNTFPEKCSWSSKNKAMLYCGVPKENTDGKSLVSWYLGLTSYTDSIWRYDTKNGTSSVLDNLSDEAGQQVDVMKPSLDSSEQYLVFINKKNDTLWSLDLTQ